jgi:glycosyltransferase involved in cell wall biosynthesis
MSAFDVLCLTSSGGEGFPNVIAEAMASGVACVSTDVGDAARIIGTTGIVVPPNDPSAFAHALEQLIASSPDALRARGAEARAIAVEEFSMPRMISAYDDLFRSVVTQ